MSENQKAFGPPPNNTNRRAFGRRGENRAPAARCHALTAHVPTHGALFFYSACPRIGRANKKRWPAWPHSVPYILFELSMYVMYGRDRSAFAFALVSLLAPG